MKTVKTWVEEHPNLWEFLLFNLLSNCATVTNFAVMWICTGFLFKAWNQIPFSFLIFQYTNIERDLGLCGFLSFLAATALAQTVNFFVQKHLVFRSNAAFARAVPRYILLAVFLVLVSAALPAYSQSVLMKIGVWTNWVPTLANGINIAVQVAVSYPVMKFWIMPEEK